MNATDHDAGSGLSAPTQASGDGCVATFPQLVSSRVNASDNKSSASAELLTLTRTARKHAFLDRRV